MGKRWSKLQAQLALILLEELDLRVQCTQIRRTSENAGSLAVELGVFVVHLRKNAIWDFPKHFVTFETRFPDGGDYLSYSVSDLNSLLREYLDTPRDQLLSKEFSRDYFGLCDLLRAADRRLSLSRLEEYFSDCPFPFVQTILDARERAHERHE